jgi:hypothetical protein
VTDSGAKPFSGEEQDHSKVHVVETDDNLSIEMARLGWDANSGSMLVGGFILLIVGLLRSWALPGLPAVITWAFPFLGAWLIWRGLASYFISTRIVLKPTGGTVDWSLGPLCSFSEINVGTLEVQRKLDDEGGVDLRIAFVEPRGKERIVRLLRNHSASECNQVAAALGAWIEKHRTT